MRAPKSDNRFGIDDVEFILVACPLDDAAVVRGEQEIQKKLPQLDMTFICVCVHVVVVSAYKNFVCAHVVYLWFELCKWTSENKVERERERERDRYTCSFAVHWKLQCQRE